MEKELFHLLESLDIDNLVGIDIHHTEDCQDEEYRLYHKDGYCFDIRKIYVCEPEDVRDVQNGVDYLEDDGYTYEFFSLWDGFIKLSLKQAIELVKRDGVFIKKDK